MGSLSSQLLTVAEIWLAEDTLFSGNFQRFLLGKEAKMEPQFKFSKCLLLSIDHIGRFDLENLTKIEKRQIFPRKIAIKCQNKHQIPFKSFKGTDRGSSKKNEIEFLQNQQVRKAN